MSEDSLEKRDRLASQEIREKLERLGLKEIPGLQDQLASLDPPARLDPRDLPVLGARLVRLESLESLGQLDQQDGQELVRLARQALMVQLAPQVRVALRVLLVRLERLGIPVLPE